MIWLPANSEPDDDSALVRRLTDELQQACGTVLALGPSELRELAQAVQYFIEVETRSSRTDTQYLIMLACKALGSLGQRDAARRLLLFGTGMVKPAEWEVTGQAAMWVVDLRQLTARPDAPIELMFFSSLSLVLDSIADVWDASRGGGVLGLRHVCGAASLFAGNRATDRDVGELAQEVVATCVRKLTRIGAQRGWESVPQVMNLDF